MIKPTHHPQMGSLVSNETYDSRLEQVIKAPEIKKPKMEYEFDLDNDPDRYLTMKTKRKKDVIKKDKQ
jgi:hypothetical protein